MDRRGQRAGGTGRRSARPPLVPSARGPHWRRRRAVAMIAPAMSELPSGSVTFLFTDVEGFTRPLRDERERYAEPAGHASARDPRGRRGAPWRRGRHTAVLTTMNLGMTAIQGGARHRAPGLCMEALEISTDAPECGVAAARRVDAILESAGWRAPGVRAVRPRPRARAARTRLDREAFAATHAADGALSADDALAEALRAG
jgi:hypothetical protein